MLLCQRVAVRQLQVITNILIRSMGPVSEEDMVRVFADFFSVCTINLLPTSSYPSSKAKIS